MKMKLLTKNIKKFFLQKKSLVAYIENKKKGKRLMCIKQKKNCIKNRKLKNSNIFNENDKHCEKQKKKKHIIIDSVYIIEDIIFIRKLLKNFIVLFKKKYHHNN